MTGTHVGATPSYTTNEYLIEPGARVRINRTADFVTCLESNARFQVSFNDGPRSSFEAGITYRTATGFTSIDLVNDGAVAVLCELAMGKGDVRDSRLSFAGVVEVADTDGTSFGDVVTGLSGAGTIDLNGALRKSYVGGGSRNLVTYAQNPNGLLIEALSLAVTKPDNYAYIFCGDANLNSHYLLYTVGGTSNFERKIEVPPGYQIIATNAAIDGGNIHTSCVYRPF